MLKRARLWLLFVQALLAAGCSDVHSPQAGDTNTSWLRLCEDDGDCRGAARCLANVCTLECAESSANSCRQLSKEAFCKPESNTCDVSCDAAQDCRAFGADFRCESGSCRPAPEFVLSAQTLGLTPPKVNSVRYRRSDTVQAVWLEDRFRVAVTVFDVSAAQPDAVSNWKSTFVVTDVFSDGRAERTLLSNDSPLSSATFTLGQTGAVARSDSESDPGTFDASLRSGFPTPTRCRLTFYDRELVQVSTGTLDCDQGLQPVTSDANGDWLTWATTEAGEGSLGRYRPSDRGWLEQPQRLAMEKGTFSTQVRDDQFWIQSENEAGASWLISVPLTGPLGDLSILEAWRPLPLQARLHYSQEQRQGGWRLLYYRDGWLVPFEEVPTADRREPVVRAVPVDPGASEQPVSFTLDAEGTIGLSALRQIPGRDLLVICYSDLIMREDDIHYELKLGWFDSRGVAVGGPLKLAHTIETPQQCSLTWSGSSLLAAWVEGAPYDPRIAHARRVQMR